MRIFGQVPYQHNVAMPSRQRGGLIFRISVYPKESNNLFLPASGMQTA